MEQKSERSIARSFTPNQVVAFNLILARTLKGWTQKEAAARIETYLGVRWSQASYSAAERSVEKKPIRNFSADEILAFSLAFQLPIAWFFLPPIMPKQEDVWVHIHPSVNPLGPGRLLEAIFELNQEQLHSRLENIFASLPAQDRTFFEKVLSVQLERYIDIYLEVGLQDLELAERGHRWQAQRLRKIREQVKKGVKESVHDYANRLPKDKEDDSEG